MWASFCLTSVQLLRKRNRWEWRAETMVSNCYCAEQEMIVNQSDQLEGFTRLLLVDSTAWDVAVVSRDFSARGKSEREKSDSMQIDRTPERIFEISKGYCLATDWKGASMVNYWKKQIIEQVQVPAREHRTEVKINSERNWISLWSFFRSVAMVDYLSLKSADWVVPEEPDTFMPTLPTHVESLPMFVRREGVQNYIKNRGSLNLGDWAIEGRRSVTPRTLTTPQDLFVGQVIPAKVKGAEATRNFLRSVTSTPNLLHGVVESPDPHHGMRVKAEGRANYVKNHDSRVKLLLESYGSDIPSPGPLQPQIRGNVSLFTRQFCVQQWTRGIHSLR